METKSTKPRKFWPLIAVIAGFFLLLSGVVSFVGYLGLPVLFPGEDILGAQMGQMAAIFIGLVCGPLAIGHGFGSLRNRTSRPIRFPPAYFFLIVFAVALGMGNLLLNFEIVEEFLFPPLFVVGAAFPTLSVLAWAYRKLSWPTTWRYAALAFVTGSTLSILIAIFLEVLLSFSAYLLLEPLEALVSSFGNRTGSTPGGLLEQLFSTPLILVFFLSIALQAPLPEEFAKAISLPLFGRERIVDERGAFAIGLASGAGFAILENMLYEGLYAQWSGWSWGGITLLRGIGSVLHPLCTGIVALGWFRARQDGWPTLFKAYLIAVGLHTLWNGGFLPFVYLTGVDYMVGSAEVFSVYGLAIEVMLVVFLVSLAGGLWWYLHKIVKSMAQEEKTEIAPVVISPRLLAAWCLLCVVVIVPIGAALGPAWKDIAKIIGFGL